MTKSVDNVAVALLLERASRIKKHKKIAQDVEEASAD